MGPGRGGNGSRLTGGASGLEPAADEGGAVAHTLHATERPSEMVRMVVGFCA